MLRRLLFGNFARVYRLSRWADRRFTVAGKTLAATLVGAAVFGIDTRQTLAYQAATLIAAAFAVALACGAAFRPRLSVRRRLPRFATAGVPLTYAVDIRNTGQRLETDLRLQEELASPLPALAELAAAPESPAAGRNWFDRAVGYPRWLDLVRWRRGADVETVALPPVPPHATVTVKVALEPLRRGYVHFERTWLLRPDPLGLVHGLRRFSAPEALLVLPRRYPVPRLQHRGRRRYQPGGETLACAVGDAKEFAGLRDYRPGDPIRHVHWRSWAKTGKPVVKEFLDEYFDRNALALDTFAAAGDAERFEEAVSIAASLACADWGPEALLDLMFVGPTAERFTSGRGLATAADMLEVLACVQPCTTRDFGRFRDLVLRHAAQISTITCILLDWDAERQELVAGLRAHGVPVTVLVVLPPGETGPLDAGPLADCPAQLVAVPPGKAAAALAALPQVGGARP